MGRLGGIGFDMLTVVARGFMPPGGKGPRCRPSNRQHPSSLHWTN